MTKSHYQLRAGTGLCGGSDSAPIGYTRPAPVLFCFVLFALQLSVCLWWHDYRRDGFPTLKFGVVMADLTRHLLREEPFALSAAPAIRARRRARALLTPYNEGDQLRLGAEAHSPCEQA